MPTILQILQTEFKTRVNVLLHNVGKFFLVGWIFQKTKGTSRAGNFHNSVSKYTNLNLEGRHTPSSSNTVGNRRYTHTHS